MHNLGLRGCTIAYVQPHARLHLVESLPACCARIQVQHPAQLRHALDPQNVAVSANEHVRPLGAKHRTHPSPPPVGVAADVVHYEPNAIEFEPLGLREAAADRWAINIPIDAAHGRDDFQRFQYGYWAYVAGVEYQIDLRERFGNGWMEETVRVRNDADQHKAS